MAAGNSVAASTAKLPPSPKIKPPKSGTASTGPVIDPKDPAFMFAPSGPPPDEANRSVLEENAGPNAGKLFLRSLPDHAMVFVNGKVVGRTPLLLVVAPGKYRIEMRGPRQASGSETVGLMREETQTVVLTLQQRYPSTVHAF